VIILCALIIILCYKKRLKFSLFLIVGILTLIKFGYTNIIFYILVSIFLTFTVTRYLIDILYKLIFLSDGNEAVIEANHEMSFQEAITLLNVKENASKKEIMQAYYAMMKKNHPDLGGLEYMAKKINCAKNILIKSKNND